MDAITEKEMRAPSPVSRYMMIMRDWRLSHGAFRLWHCLNHYKDNGTYSLRTRGIYKCIVGYRTMMEDLQCGALSIPVWIRELVATGWLKVGKAKGYNQKGHKQANMYWLLAGHKKIPKRRTTKPMREKIKRLPARKNKSLASETSAVFKTAKTSADRTNFRNGPLQSMSASPMSSLKGKRHSIDSIDSDSNNSEKQKRADCASAVAFQGEPVASASGSSGKELFAAMRLAAGVPVELEPEPMSAAEESEPDTRLCLQCNGEIGGPIYKFFCSEECAQQFNRDETRGQDDQ